MKHIFLTFLEEIVLLCDPFLVLFALSFKIIAVPQECALFQTSAMNSKFADKNRAWS